MNHTPSATLSAVTRSVAFRTASGSAMSAGAFGCTSFTVRSSTGKPPCDCVIRVGNFDAAEVAVVRVRRHDSRFAQHRIGNPRFDALDEPVGVDERDGLEPARLGERRRRHTTCRSRISCRTVALLRIAALITPCGVIHSWCTRSATKRGPGAGPRPSGSRRYAPLTYCSLRCVRRCADSRRRRALRRARTRSPRASSRFVVDRARERMHPDLRPRQARLVRLAERVAGAVAGVADRLQVRRRPSPSTRAPAPRRPPRPPQASLRPQRRTASILCAAHCSTSHPPSLVNKPLWSRRRGGHCADNTEPAGFIPSPALVAARRDYPEIRLSYRACAPAAVYPRRMPILRRGGVGQR